MGNKSKIVNDITEIANILNTNNIKYIFGASCALLVHGLDVTPNDIDIVVEENDVLNATKLLSNFVCELHTFKINEDEVTEVIFKNVPIKVNKLEAEYKYYLKRKGESEKVDTKIKMIEEKLGI